MALPEAALGGSGRKTYIYLPTPVSIYVAEWLQIAIDCRAQRAPSESPPSESPLPSSPPRRLGRMALNLPVNALAGNSKNLIN